MNSGFGPAKVNLIESSSIFSTLAGSPLITVPAGKLTVGTASSSTTSFQKNMKSSAVSGSPSDHLIPLRKLMVSSV